MKINNDLHAKITIVSKRFFQIAFLVITLFMIYGSISSYRSSKAILANGKTIDATLVFDGVSNEADSKSQQFNYTYSFIVNNAEYYGNFSVSTSNAGQYEDKKTIKVVYNLSNPADADRLSNIEAKTDLAEVAKKNAFGLFGIAFLALCLHVLITGVFLEPKDKPAEEDKASALEKTEEATEEPPVKKSFLQRVISFLIKAALVIGVIYFFASLQGEVKDNFKHGVLQAEKQKCNGDAACLANLEEKFEQCVEDNHSSHKSGKYKRSYTLDQDGFDVCLDWHADSPEATEASSAEETSDVSEEPVTDEPVAEEAEEGTVEPSDGETDFAPAQEAAAPPN